MVAFATSSLVQTNRNIDQIEAIYFSAKDLQEEEPGQVQLILKNIGDSPCKEIEVLWEKDRQQVAEIKPQFLARVDLPLSPGSIGRHTLPHSRVRSDFPFGLSLSGKTLRVSSEYYIFPKSEGSSLQDLLNRLGQSSLNESFDFKGHRNYSLSDQPKSIDWKAYARTQKLLTKEYESPQQQEISIDAKETMGSNEIERKRQLAKWVREAEQAKFIYELILPSKHLTFGQGLQHQINCLKAITDENL